ncbi:sigma-54-dependent Fis family transcriptional regulator [Viridibacillus arvi]|uniref:sigma-54-dependent Fis family transcriptional regulator n=1 Tax=Viridibacillus arvi TaxID=263475 RepID=UPI00187BB572|nr:sigma-54-dependent Fis family transcriptional regulator [Viridibacillus sp. JNUCC-6]QOV13066.1 sigma 54-interacting transcriptional regulator [Viridibacillus sp. JNUCC-6]
MRVEDVMMKDSPTCTVNYTIQETLEIFAKINSQIIPVVNDDKRLIGLLTKNKIIQILAEGYSFQYPISSFINFNPIFLYPDQDINETRKLLLNHQIGHAPVVNRQMQPIGILSTSQILFAYDLVYDRLQTQQSLLFENLNFGLFSVDTKFKVNAINPVAEKILQLLPNKQHVFNELNGFEEITNLLTGILHHKEQIMKKKMQLNGHSLVVQSYPLIEKNKLVGSMVIMDDWTNIEKIANELRFSKEWEEKLRSVIELAYDGIILVDQKAEITMVNNGFCELYNVQSNELLGKSISNMYPDLGLDEALQTGVRITNVAKLIGKTQCLITILPIKNNEEIIGAICKITYRGLKHLQEAIKKVNNLEQQVTYYQKELNELKGTKYSFANIIGESSNIKRIKNEALAASNSLSTVLLLGESGTGKELFAHGIHASSSQTGMFIQVNCAAIPPELMESEFFGYAEGSFTGAKKGGKKGKFEMAQNGTLFLDEIGDMPLSLQSKLLRVLQEKEFEPIGSNRIIKLQTKIIAATNQNLETLIKEGKFREDLYYRLNIMRINIPPLRERIEDIPDIAESIISKLKLSGFHLKGITHSALTKLLNYNWPGNVRELHNILERAANLTSDGYIDAQHLPESFNANSNIVTSTENIRIDQTNTLLAYSEELNNKPYWNAIDHKEKELILAALKETNGNKAKASRILGISRTWLYEKIKKYNISI